MNHESAHTPTAESPAGLPAAGEGAQPLQVGALNFVHAGFGEQAVDYRVAWEQQRALHAQVSTGQAPSTVILLEHPPVFTAGKRTAAYDRPTDGSQVIDVDRGGRITWHGPGQLVGYPIIALHSPIDVVAYVRRLEDALIGTCARLGVHTVRIPERSGVWVPADDRGRDRKIAAIGVRVAAGTTMHGFSLNANPDLSWYTRIVPCGIDDADVTSLSTELDRDVTVAEILPIVTQELVKARLAG